MPSANSERRNATILATVFLFPLVILCLLFLFKRSSEKRAAADPAIYAAQSSPNVASQIGLPIEAGWSITGNILTSGNDGNADLQIPLHGSHGQGMLIEWAQRQKGRWHLCSLQFNSAIGGKVILVDPGNSGCEPE